MEVGQRDAGVPCHPGTLLHGDTGLPGDAAGSITPCPRNGDKGHRQQHTSHHFIVTAARPSSQRGSGSSPSPPSTALTPTAAHAPPSFILHLAFSILTAQSSSGALLPSCSGAEGETKGAERASVPVSFPMGCRWSHHTSMPGACPKPSACTSSSLSPLFSVRRTVGTGEWLLGHCALGFVALVWV